MKHLLDFIILQECGIKFILALYVLSTWGKKKKNNNFNEEAKSSSNRIIL